MAFHVFDDSTQGAILVLSCITLPLCTLATILRFGMSRRASRKNGLEDWFALGALITFITYTAIVLRIVFMLNGASFSVLSPTQLLYAAKLVYANSPFYWTNQLCAKLSILLLYSRIFSVNTAYRWWIIGIAVVHILFSIAVLLVALFGCQPISKGWNPPLPGSCVTTAPGHFLAGTESINSGIDFAMVILAIFMIRELNMGTSKKLKISVLFAIGGLAGIIGFVKIGQQYATSHGKSRAVNFTIGLWTIIQQACSILCCCAPIYKSLLPPLNLFSRLSSTTNGSWTRVVRTVRTKRSQSSKLSSPRQGSAGFREATVADSQKHNWVILDDSSQKRPVTAEQDLLHDQDQDHLGESGYSVGTVQPQYGMALR